LAHSPLNIGNTEGKGLLVYSHKITSRLSYSFKLIFKRILRMEVFFTSDIEEFTQHTGAKISYTKNPISDEIFFRSSPLLFEQGIRDLEFKVHDWKGVPAFFTVGEMSAVPYDIFAAAFFLSTRYEEYYPQVHDQYDRYDATNSVAFQNGFLEIPVIDIWSYRIFKLLKDRFPHCNFPEKNFTKISTINVNDAYAFKHKGFFRNFGGWISDLYHFDYEAVSKRFLVIFKLRKDPYDNDDTIIKLGKDHKVKTMFFFLFSEYNTYDRNIPFANLGYRKLIKSVIDYVPFGQLFSYFTMKNTPKMIKEKNRFENIVIRPVTKSRQHFNRFELPKTYQTLIDNDIREEYTMGYHTHSGFRAGTCSPFYFFDLEYEIQTPLKIFSFCCTDELLKETMTVEEANQKMESLFKQVKLVNGTFITTFHNAILSEAKWMELYEKMLKMV